MAATNLQGIVDTYGCMPEYQAMKSFFANSKNSAGIADATAKYGTPKENTKSYNTGWGIFKKNWGWKDFPVQFGAGCANSNRRNWYRRHLIEVAAETQH